MEHNFVLRVTESEFYLQRCECAGLTHNLTHNRKRAGGGNGAESTIVLAFLEQKRPQSAEWRRFEGGHLHPYAQEGEVWRGLFSWLEEMAVESSVRFVSCPADRSGNAMAERWAVSCLRDFLYLELAKAIEHGNAPRQCRLCGHWFLHKQGDKLVYCGRVAPGETEKTCREVGARAVFEKKIQEKDTWKIYKRAYKKYYARFMKGNMSREEFSAWVEHAAAQRDFTIELLKTAKSEEERGAQIEALREDLNRL